MSRKRIHSKVYFIKFASEFNILLETKEMQQRLLEYSQDIQKIMMEILKK